MDLLTSIYGIALGLLLFLIIRSFFSVYYTPGVNVLYDSPVTQQLFPSAMNKLFPTWGFNRAGMYDGQAFKFGPGSFYPESGKGYVPNKYGYPGASPSGGLRPSFPIPAESPIGFWGKTPIIQNTASFDIYDNTSPPSPTQIQVGWWGDD